jgi:hypothetical protein
MKKRRLKMKFKEKLVILIVALLLSSVLFNAISSSSIDLLRLGKEAGNEIISNYLANEGKS